MPTKTEAKPKAKPQPAAEPVAQTTVSTKLVQAIKAQIDASRTLLSKKRVTAEVIVAEAKRMNLTERSQIQAMVMGAWLAAKGFGADTPDATRKAAEATARPDVSKVMTLAYPEKAKSAAELTLAYEHNDGLGQQPKQAFIGENKLLEIARGNLTFKQALAGKQAKRDNSSSGLDATIPPFERFRNAITGLCDQFKVGGKDRITEEEARKAANEAITGWINARSK